MHYVVIRAEQPYYQFLTTSDSRTAALTAVRPEPVSSLACEEPTLLSSISSSVIERASDEVTQQRLKEKWKAVLL